MGAKFGWTRKNVQTVEGKVTPNRTAGPVVVKVALAIGLLVLGSQAEEDLTEASPGTVPTVVAVLSETAPTVVIGIAARVTIGLQDRHMFV